MTDKAFLAMIFLAVVGAIQAEIKCNEDWPTVVTMKTRGRLGNHLWSYLKLTAVALKYGVKAVLSKEARDSLARFFQGFEDSEAAQDLCGYTEFYEQFQQELEAMILEHYRNVSGGTTVTLRRQGQSMIVEPKEVVQQHGKVSAESLIESDRFRGSFSVDYSQFPAGCQYKWRPFWEDYEELARQDIKLNQALLLNPGFTRDRGNVIHTTMGLDKVFFNERLRFKDKFVLEAQRILRSVTDQHLIRQGASSSKDLSMEYVFVGIHWRRTDHLLFEMENGMPNLDADYFVRAMKLFREKFPRHQRQGRLVFVLVSDDMEWSKKALGNVALKEKDLYFVGSGSSKGDEAIGTDLALLAACNHTIESHGTFSFFAGALAGGLKLKPEYFAQYRNKAKVSNFPFQAHKNLLDQDFPRIHTLTLT